MLKRNLFASLSILLVTAALVVISCAEKKKAPTAPFETTEAAVGLGAIDPEDPVDDRMLLVTFGLLSDFHSDITVSVYLESLVSTKDQRLTYFDLVKDADQASHKADIEVKEIESSIDILYPKKQPKKGLRVRFESNVKAAVGIQTDENCKVSYDILSPDEDLISVMTALEGKVLFREADCPAVIIEKVKVVD